MHWVKVTPDTMPPDDRPVFATIKYKKYTNISGKDVLDDVCWIKDFGIWVHWKDGEMIPQGFFTITHWMPRPQPAED